VRERHDAGVCHGKLVSRDMIAQRIGPDIPMTVVAAPSCFAGCAKPKRPQDLAAHDCINLRLPTHGELFTWIFRKAGRDLRVTTEGRLVFTSLQQVREACVAGFGVAYLPRNWVAHSIDEGTLVEVLADWRKTFEGYHLYYPRRRQHPPALAALIGALRHRA
jgi:DNA-binding transcriptional LysR family regulator